MDCTLLDVEALDFGPPTKLGNSQQQVIPVSTIAGRFDWSTRLTLQLGKDQDTMLTTQYGVGTPLPNTDPSRRNLDLLLTPELEHILRAVDAKVVTYCSEKCEELFKTKTLTKQHTPLVKERDDGNAYVRVKVNLGGDKTKPTEVRVLSDDRSKVRRRDYTSITRDSQLLTIVDTPGVWFSPAGFGVSLTARSIIVAPSESRDGLSMFNLKPGVTEVSVADDDDPSAEAEYVEE